MDYKKRLVIYNSAHNQQYICISLWKHFWYGTDELCTSARFQMAQKLHRLRKCLKVVIQICWNKMFQRFCFLNLVGKGKTKKTLRMSSWRFSSSRIFLCSASEILRAPEPAPGAAASCAAALNLMIADVTPADGLVCHTNTYLHVTFSTAVTWKASNNKWTDYSVHSLLNC